MDTEVVNLLIDIFEQPTNNAYKARRNHLRQLFESYTGLEPNKTKTLLERLLELDKEYCIKTQNDIFMREHNTFVIRYFSKKQPMFSQIAIMQNISSRQAQFDVDKTLDRLMIFAYGIDGLKI